MKAILLGGLVSCASLVAQVASSGGAGAGVGSATSTAGSTTPGVGIGTPPATGIGVPPAAPIGVPPATGIGVPPATGIPAPPGTATGAAAGAASGIGTGVERPGFVNPAFPQGRNPVERSTINPPGQPITPGNVFGTDPNLTPGLNDQSNPGARTVLPDDTFGQGRAFGTNLPPGRAFSTNNPPLGRPFLTNSFPPGRRFQMNTNRFRPGANRFPPSTTLPPDVMTNGAGGTGTGIVVPPGSLTNRLIR